MAVWPYLHPSISTALMRPRRPKQYCLQLVIYIFIYTYLYYIYICFGGSGGVWEEECHAILPSSSTKLSFYFLIFISQVDWWYKWGFRGAGKIRKVNQTARRATGVCSSISKHETFYFSHRSQSNKVCNIYIFFWYDFSPSPFLFGTSGLHMCKRFNCEMVCLEAVTRVLKDFAK